jgi:serine/threonine-protein kinase
MLCSDPSVLARLPGESSDDWAGRLIQDLTARRQANAPARVEDYVAALSELAQEPETLTELIVAEWSLRRQAGEPVALADYTRRFPALRAQIEVFWRADEELNPPEQFGPFRLLRELGQGGFAIVRLVEPVAGGAPVALKVLKPPDGTDPAEVEADQRRRQRFIQEAAVMHTLAHRHLCRVLEVGETEGRPWFTMPYYPNGSVDEELIRGPLTEREATQRVIDAARGLQHAHAQGIIHRDLKPGNLLLAAPDQVVVADFGLALWYHDEAERLTRTGECVGTVSYFSPEQATGGKNLLPASDIFSLGVVLYQLLSGQLPFRGTALETLQAIVQDEPAPLAALRPGIAPALAAICAKALAKRPEDRYPSMAAFADDLERFLNGEWAPAATPTENWGLLPSRAQRPRRLAWVAGAAVLLLLIVLGVALTWRLWPVSPPKQPERPVVSTRTPIGLRGHLQALHDDLAKMEAVQRPHVRYLSLRAVHDNPYVSDEDYNAHLPALERVLSRLSHNQPHITPLPVDAANSLLRIDLRDLDWHPALEWETLWSSDPYSVRYDAEFVVDEEVRRLAVRIYELIGVRSLDDNPVVRADWLLAAATQSPLYEKLQRLHGEPAKTPPFDLGDPEDALARVIQLYREEPLDARVLAAELGLLSPDQLRERLPADHPEMGDVLEGTISRRRWAGDDGPGQIRDWTRLLKLGQPGPALGAR